MAKLLSSKEIVGVLLSNGFVFVSQRGSHAKFRKRIGGEVLTVIVPMNKKGIPVGTFRSIVRQSRLTHPAFKVV